MKTGDGDCKAVRESVAAEMLGFTEGSLRNRRLRGELPPGLLVKLPGRTVRYSLPALRRLVDGELEDAAEHTQ